MIKNLTIDRKKWGRGSTGGYLLRKNNNKMCCLGFFSRACGFKPKEIRGMGMPHGLLNNMTYSDKFDNGGLGTLPDVKKYLEKRGFDFAGFRQVNAALAGRLADINDNGSTTDAHKEKKIIELFKKAGIKVKFIN